MVLARKKDDGALHAVKAVRKEKLLASGSAAIQHVLDENSILQRLRHPFVLTYSTRSRTPIGCTS